ncbi:MAG: HAMP domain-containing sensor histidine kinase [Byssovorax sp.]
MNPLLCFIRARLRRRLFAWFGATILFTGMAVMFVMGLTDASGGGWRRDVERVRTFIGGRFDRVWDDPVARAELGLALSRDLDATVTVEDHDKQPLSTFGSPCATPPYVVPVHRGEETLGFVTVCTDRYKRRPWQIALPLLVTGILLWGASGAIARRLARPLMELARVAQEIGSGNFSARMRIDQRHLHGETAALAFTLNDMAARIEHHLGEQRELLAAVSHELRTPLARIRLLTEMARDRGTSDKTLDDLDREVVEMDALVGDLLASSRLDFQVLSRRTLDAAEVAVRAVERAGVDAGVLAIECEGDDEAQTLQVDADATLLGRALSNLIDNAKKHGGGVSRFRVRRDAGRIWFEVEDRGAGFAAGDEVRIFEPFYRRGEHGSLGLGLSLVKRIAEAHGGRAFAENRPGGGALVGIELPVSGSAG